MDESSRIDQCFKACENKYEEEDQEDELEEDLSEENNNNSKATDGGSSISNSTIEENENKSSSTTVRPYVRSKTPRLRWTHDLHLRFVQAVERLGGQERATPKLVLQLMNVKGLNIAHVKSHLQMYRSKKIDDPSEDNRNLVDYGDGNIYNLSQLPMLQSYNQGYNLISTFRYGDAHWKSGHEKWMQNVYNMSGRSTVIDYKARPRFFSSVNEKMLGRRSSTNNCQNNNIDISASTELSKWKSHEKKCGLHQSMNDHEIKSSNKLQQEKAKDLDLEITSLTPAKRKAVSAANCELDLNLTLGVKPISDEDHEYLSLSLYSPSSSKKIERLKMADKEKINAERASTLDLII